jgi:NAD(P)-dependent dehydrogenase (short-subunit alcohol dehydrogenase family)
MKLFSLVSVSLVALVAVLWSIISYLLGGGIAILMSPSFSFKDIPDLTGKVAIVTGSNTGLGFVSARELAKKGAHVILAARSEEKGMEAVKRIKQEIGDIPGAHLLEFMSLDLSSFNKVREFSIAFLDKNVSLDILILNAGILVPYFELTEDGLEMQIGTNHFGHFLLVRLLTPLLVASKARVVSLSSLAHISTYTEGIRFEAIKSNKTFIAFMGYGQSKLANILFSNELAVRLNGTGDIYF